MWTRREIIMNFDNFNKITFAKKDKLLEDCKIAERNIKVNPFIAMINARSALEVLCRTIIKEKNLTQVKESDGTANLSTQIETCVNNGVFNNMEAATSIRKLANNVVHGNRGFQNFHKVNDDTVKKALETVSQLYLIMQEVFDLTDTQFEFDQQKIPFGYYEIVRAVEKAPNEIIVGEYNYFVRDPQNNTFYFQILHQNSSSENKNNLGERSVLVGNRIKEDKSRKSYLLDVHYPSNVMPGSEHEYIAYSVFSDSRLLSEIREGELNEKQIVEIALDLVCVLEELRKIGDGISHRNIQPGNVIITPNESHYLAALVNMETAKITGYEKTIYKDMKSLEVFSANSYMPPEVREGLLEETNVSSWEKVDIYSIAKIMLYCMNPSLVKLEVDMDDVYEYFSEETGNILDNILNSSLNLIYELCEFREELENVLKELQYEE